MTAADTSTQAASLPRVSLIVPSFNEPEHTLRASLDSLRQQTFADFECIVVDESTRDELASACQRFCLEDARFIYVRPEQRIGLAASLNLGIARARGELIARFDSDDLCVPDRLAQQVAFLDEHSVVSVVGGALEIIGEDERPIALRNYPSEPEDIARGIHLTNTIAHPTVMFRKSLVTTHGGYNSAFRFSEDLELWLRWMNAGVVFANLPNVLVRYRQEQTRRSSRHWRFNLQARLRNFGRRYWWRRLVGIVCVGAWMLVPEAFQEQFFRAWIFSRQDRPISG